VRVTNGPWVIGPSGRRAVAPSRCFFGYAPVAAGPKG
jgi:hypothetical protein